MRYDNLLEAVTESEPCGPDLDEIGDEAYLNYVLPATGRLPSGFYHPKTGAPFDRASIDLKSEVQAISGLLERSRDLRLLALEARFQSLSGGIAGFAECLQAMAGLLESRWEDVHPKAIDGDFTLRQNTLSALDDRISIILPLEYAPLARDKRLGQLCLRDYRVAIGQVQSRAEASAPDRVSVLEAMQANDNRQSLEAHYEAVRAAEASLSAMRAKFMDAAGYEYAPNFDGLQEVLGQLKAFIEAALPALASQAGPDQAVAGESAAVPEGPAGDQAAGGLAGPVDVVATAVGSHAAAASALLAVERYFARTEPSSPALILIHQARMLVGKPLVVALETLMPENAERALIRFDSGSGLQLTMPAMRSITEAATTDDAESTDDDASEQTYAARTRQEAQSIIHGVETFFRVTEPSSPIPMLLAKTKTFMNRDFATILMDIVKNENQNS